MKFIIIILCLLFSINLIFGIQVGIDGDIGVDLIPVTPTNYSTISVNDSDYWDGYDTPSDYPNVCMLDEYNVFQVNQSFSENISVTEYARIGHGIGIETDPSTSSAIKIGSSSGVIIDLAGDYRSTGIGFTGDVGAGGGTTKFAVSTASNLVPLGNWVQWVGFNLVSSITTNKNITNWIGGQIASVAVGSGTSNIVAGIKFVPLWFGGTANNLIGYQYAPVKAGGTWENEMAIDIGNVNKGIKNWAIKTNLGLVSFGDDLEFRNDNDEIRFGSLNASIYSDGTNMVFDYNSTSPTAVAWFSGNLSAVSYDTRTSVFDTSNNAQDYIKDANYYTNLDGTINHSKFYGYKTYEVTDFSRPVITFKTTENCFNLGNLTQEVLNEINSDTDIVISDYRNGAYTICSNETIQVTKYPYKKIEEGVSINSEIDVLRQRTYEQDLEIDLLKSELCMKDNTYSWCLGVGL